MRSFFFLDGCGSLVAICVGKSLRRDGIGVEPGRYGSMFNTLGSMLGILGSK